uniref:Membrane spanning 4-domains A12 n=1 Tax=Equus caballus TaxID=9796 RepID=A0A5F5PKJ5_HORSE
RMFSKPTTQPGVYGTTPNPYIANNSMAPGSQQPLSFIIPRNQPQSGQPPFITSPEIRTNNQQGQGNVLMVNPATVTATTNFKEEGKTLGFIITGTLSVSGSKHLSLCLIKGSLGMNIVSAIFALTGVILLLVDVSINGLPTQDFWAVLSGKGISAILIIFSLLEFCITCTTAHFAMQEIAKWSVLTIPNVYATSPLTPGFASAPPRSDGHPANIIQY